MRRSLLSLMLLVFGACGSESVVPVPAEPADSSLAESFAALHPALCVDDAEQLVICPGTEGWVRAEDAAFVQAAILTVNKPDDGPDELQRGSGAQGGKLPARAKVTSRSGRGESQLDVWITFTGNDWNNVWFDGVTGWATDKVIAEL